MEKSNKTPANTSWSLLGSALNLEDTYFQIPMPKQLPH